MAEHQPSVSASFKTFARFVNVTTRLALHYVYISYIDWLEVISYIYIMFTLVT